MGTPLSTVFEKFLNQLDDKELLLIEEDILKKLMLNFLENAITDFTQCKKDLSFTPPKISEVRQKMDGQTSEIEIPTLDALTTIKKVIGVNTQEEYKYIVINGNTLDFGYAIPEDIIIFYEYEGAFIETLEMIEIRILAFGMLLSYIRIKINNEDALKQHVTDKDFSKLSGANMLLRLTGLEKHYLKQFDILQGKYAFKNFKGWD